jgi:hypothetical protein
LVLIGGGIGFGGGLESSFGSISSISISSMFFMLVRFGGQSVLFVGLWRVARRGVLWLVTSSRLALSRGPAAAAAAEAGGLVGGISESISMLLLLLLLLLLAASAVSAVSAAAAAAAAVMLVKLVAVVVVVVVLVVLVVLVDLVDFWEFGAIWLISGSSGLGRSLLLPLWGRAGEGEARG